MTLFIGLLALALALPAVGGWRTGTHELAARAQAIATDRQRPDDERFQDLVDLTYDYYILVFPESATRRGDPRGRDRWTDLSPDGIAQRNADERTFLAALDSIDPAALDDTGQLNHALLRDRLLKGSGGGNTGIERQRFPVHQLPVNQMSGVQQDVAQLMALTQPRTAVEYEDMLARLAAVPQRIDQTIDLMRAGLAGGVTPPAITLRDVPQQVRNQLVDDPAESPVLVAFAEFPNSIDPLQREALRQRAHTVFSEEIAPAWERLLAFLEEDYLPGARQGIAARDLPDGEAWYRWNVAWRTTTDLTPDQIHEIGLGEVARIRAEMEQVIELTGFEGSFAEFLEFLRNDPRFYHTTAEGLLAEYRDICKRADPELMKLFGHLPRTPYGVVAVPSYAEQSVTTAYYQRGSVEAGRPGYYFANTYALDTRPRWEMEALSLHEAVPGHHLQIAIQDELEGVPWYRRISSYTGFSEGWGLYSESLGEEMGFYRDPYSKFGQLTYEMWRAIRLVVDTGMHWKGWSRQQAIEYFKANAAKQEHDIIVEIDRYIVWPGQALAYKLGELKIKELRAYATEALGEDFDVRAFHDQVLGRGAVPLDNLEAHVRAWVAELQGT